MTKYFHKKGNRIIKYTFLCIIEDIMKSNATAHFCWLDEGYDSVKDMIHFSSCGHKCILRGVSCPNPSDGTIGLTLWTDWNGEKNQCVDVTLNARDIHINTLEKIACEVYNTLWNPEKDDDWDMVKDESISLALDTYLFH